MGDLRDWSSEPNGSVTEDRHIPSSPSISSLQSSSPNPNPTAIGAGRWGKAEQTTQEIISRVQPTVVSEERRKEVIDYVQRLIRGCLGCEVFPFGSVPLKTYLPDGDIDLTAFGGIPVEDALASDVCSVLEAEDRNRTAKFVVKDVQLIRAEVKLVKCLVQNIVVDISFNQLGGLCTLCFLEKVDRLIGKDHLFKRSIILIKAWCYYESRILGAHHGLISTYALETLVLYIFHLFYSSLNGPLAVLYKFLDYFSKFDWENFCISLNGPVRISSLPEIVAETPENGGGQLLLSNEFFRDCMEKFSVPSRGSETSSRIFPQKHLNIVDPLKENNNLGRSVSKGNFYRIRSAFTYGARKLGHILSQPEENLADELHKFFTNTLDRHGSGQRPDVQDHVLVYGHDGFSPAFPFSGTETYEEEMTVSEFADLAGISGQRRMDPEESLCNGLNKIEVSGTVMEQKRNLNKLERGSIRVFPLPEADSYANGGTAVSGYRLSGDAKDLATLRIQSPRISEETSKLSPSSSEDGISPLGKPHLAPYLHFSRTQNGKMRNGGPDLKQEEKLDLNVNKLSSGMDTRLTVHCDRDENQFVSNHEADGPSNSRPLEEFRSGYWEAVNSLPDLSGDHDSQLNSLQYGRWCYEYGSSAHVSPRMAPQFQSQDTWDAMRWSPRMRQNVFPHMNANGVVSGPQIYLMNPPITTGATFGMEEIPKPRGTGTYFPNTNHYRERSSSGRGRNQGPARSPRNNGHAMEINHELSQTQLPFHQIVSSDFPQLVSPSGKAFPNANGSFIPSERAVESYGLGVPLLENNRHLNPSSLLAQNSTGTPRPRPVLVTDQDRMAARSYHLKDEEDFPPLST